MVKGGGFISTKQLLHAFQRGNLSLEECKRVKHEDLIRYYNQKLQGHFRYSRWTDFFYVYRLAEESGVNEATYVMTAHAYELAYANTTKSLATAELIKSTPGYPLCLSLLQAYRELRALKIAPLSSDWTSVMNLCIAVTLGHPPPLTKYDKILANPRTSWHYELTPWKYHHSVIDRIDDSIFKHRRLH